MGTVNWSPPADAGGNAESGTVQAPPSFDPQDNRAVIDIADLDAHFEETDQHKVGRIDIMGFGVFTTVATESRVGDDKVTIINAPASIVNASGADYVLWDDDVGSDPNGAPPFIMVGFDAPPVTLPKVPDTGLMAQVFQNAYVEPVPPDMQYYDSNAPFKFNVDSDSEAKNAGNEKRDLTSAVDYWVAHITSAFQGSVDKDGDPDIEQAGEGLQYGVTIESGLWPLPVHSSGSLIFLETIRDDKRGNPPSMTELERYTVVHEAGHQFLLQHTDGYAPPDGAPGDYIMTNVTDQTGMAPNVAFSAGSLKKIRESKYPPQP
ncbi:MAG: hypothetical protein JSU86_07925 [Phycisphaerales bacterium]|nr:MAG: hypothetical protein JSU86_07925 [Phycisphaerales bacterium]